MQIVRKRAKGEKFNDEESLRWNKYELYTRSLTSQGKTAHRLLNISWERQHTWSVYQ